MAKTIPHDTESATRQAAEAERQIQKQADAQAKFDRETKRLSDEQRRDAAARASDPDGAAQRDRDRKHTRGKGDTK